MRHAMEGLAVLVGLGLVVAGTPTSAGAAEPRPPSLIRSDTFNLASALQRAAARFFPPPAKGTLQQVVLTDRFEVHSEGLEYELYEVQRGYEPVGHLVRAKVLVDSSTRLDLAFKMEGGRVTAVEPLRVPVVEGRAVVGIDRALGAFAEKSAGNYAPGLSALCRSLVFVSRMAEGAKDSGPKMTEEEGRAFSKAFFDSLPKPDPTRPDFAVTTMAGVALKPGSFSGKPLLVFFGTVLDDDSLDMQAVVHEFARSVRNRVGVVTVLCDRTEYVDRWLDRGGTLEGHTVVDFEEGVRESFKVPTVPYVVGYDAAGGLKVSLLHRDRTTTMDELRRFREATLGKGQ